MDTPSDFLDYLTRVHERTRRVVLCIPPEVIEWSPAAGRFTMGDIVRHLATIERYMYAETVQDKPSLYRGQGRELAEGYEQVVAFYDELHQQSLAIFGALTEQRFRERCLTPAGAAIPVWKWLRAMIEHEIHHRGQLYLLLGLIGANTPPIYGLTSEELRKRSESAAD